MRGDNITPEFRSECRIRLAAREYALNVSALQASAITPEQHRAENRRIKAELTDSEWEQAKARTLSVMDRNLSAEWSCG
jgi:post-segregation antitoxin (ccd killing protein)